MLNVKSSMSESCILTFAFSHFTSNIPLPYIADVERLAVAREHLLPQPRMIRVFEFGILANQELRFAAGFFEDLAVTLQIGES